MHDALLGIAIVTRVAWTWTAARTRLDERGEGVISAAIAVLIMAFLGVAVWFGFKTTLSNTQTNVDTQVNQIGK